MSKKKFVKARWVSQQEFKDLIAAAIAMRGAAKPTQIAEDLEYDDCHGVAVTMNNMVAQGWLLRDANGRYSVSPSYEIRHRRLLEMDIADTIRSFGGLATWSEIMAAYDTLPSRNDHVPYGGRGGGSQSHLTDAMKKSDKICRYDLFEGRRMWGLKWDELLKIPLTGRNAEFLMLFEFLEIDGPAGKGGARREAEMRENVQDLFDRVGFALTAVREFKGMSPADVAANGAVQDALIWIKNGSPELVRKITADIEKDAYCRAKEDERGTDDDYIWELREVGMEQFTEHMLSCFEHGNPLMHKLAPVALYYALASLFNICPASLSRGLAVKLLDPVKLPEGWQALPTVPLDTLGEAEIDGSRSAL